MKTFRFRGFRSIDEDFTIDVDAESLEEAQKMIDDGNYDEYGHSQSYVDGSDEIEFDEEVEDDDDESDEDDDDRDDYEMGGEGEE